MKRKQDPFDISLFDIFREFCPNDEDCEKAINDAKKAFTMLKSDKLFRSSDSRKGEL